MPSAYVRVHKPHKNEVYILDGHKKYPDGTFEKGKIYIENFSDSRYKPDTVNTKKSRIMPFEDITRYTADHRQINESPPSHKNYHNTTYIQSGTNVTHFDYDKPNYFNAKNDSGAVRESPRKPDGFYTTQIM